MSDPAPELDPATFRSLMEAGVPVLDLRPLALFARGHVRGAVSAPYIRYTFLDTVLDFIPSRRLALVDDIPALTALAMSDLRADGFEVAGILSGGTRAWEAAGQPSDRLDQLSAADLLERLEGKGPPRVIDVREGHELLQGKIPGSVHIPLGSLPASVGELDPEDTHVLVCAGGGRSLAAQAYLHRLGFKDVHNLAGGMIAWIEAGYRLEL